MTRQTISDHRTLCDQAVQILEIGTFQAQVSSADIVNSFIVDHERTIGVLESSMSGKDRIVWLDNGSRSLWCWVHAELQLDFLAIINGKSLHEQSSKTRTSSSSERVEDKETLKSRTVICNMTDFVENLVDQFLSNSVVTAGIVV